MAMKSLEDLFIHTLKDVYYAEETILKSLEKMEKKANSDKLKQLFSQHHRETEEQIERLKKVFELCGEKPAGEKCEAILGITEEAEQMMKEIQDGETLDAGLTAAAQAVEHYEISRYGSLCAWAEELGQKDAIGLLSKTLEEEKNTDGKLTRVAENRLNKKAA